MRKTALNAVAVMTAVAVALVALVVVMIAVDHLHVVMVLAAVARVQQVVVADSVRVVKVAPHVVMEMTAVARRVVLVIVTAKARLSVSGWKFRKTCSSSSFQMTRRWTPSLRMCARRVMPSACLMPHVWC